MVMMSIYHAKPKKQDGRAKITLLIVIIYWQY